jgi:hypothetical protein
MYIACHDLDATVRGRTLRAEVKARAQGFGMIYNWLNDRDALIVKSDRKPPLVVLPPDLAAQLVSLKDKPLRGGLATGVTIGLWAAEEVTSKEP